VAGGVVDEEEQLVGDVQETVTEGKGVQIRG
jgi:hypothetical protein